MRLVADENVHGKLVECLRNAGYDLTWIKEVARGAADREILERADLASAIFITNDRDFGELVFKTRLRPPFAILYTRTPHRAWELTASLLIGELERGVTAGQMAIITERGVRRRPFPSGDSNA